MLLFINMLGGISCVEKLIGLFYFPTPQIRLHALTDSYKKYFIFFKICMNINLSFIDVHQ